MPYDRPEYHVRGIAFVREPTERFISHYFYCRHNSQGDFDPLAKQLDITAYTRAVIQDQNRVGLVNGQTYHLMGDRSSQYFQQNFELLKQRIEQQQLLLFPVSRFDEACMLLEHLFPEDFHDCAYIRQNISDKDQSVTDSVREMIYSSMTLDYQLLELANIQTNQLIASTFASEVEKQTQNLKFEQRCQKLQHQLNSPWRRIKQLGLRTTQRLLDDSPELKAFVQ
ncbi:MAG: hypothetical protein HC920_11040 [Oscillatoriales cyanobacterium SM2_3_0]|nr:hypothetical protein [Oscillatoriales cyanobacterium SM2_3_0]